MRFEEISIDRYERGRSNDLGSTGTGATKKRKAPL